MGANSLRGGCWEPVSLSGGLLGSHKELQCSVAAHTKCTGHNLVLLSGCRCFHSWLGQCVMWLTNACHPQLSSVSAKQG